MPKKNSGENLGRSLLRKKHNNYTASSRHTTIDESDGKLICYVKFIYEMINSTLKWFWLTIFDHWLGGHQPISITENTSIDEFLSNAEAAQKSFEAERGTAAIAVSNKIIIKHNNRKLLNFPRFWPYLWQFYWFAVNF